MTTPLSVLLVDDDEDEYTIVRGLLRDVKSDACVTWVPSYDLGLTKIRERAWDVCLVDYHLGAQSGLDFAEATASLGCHSPVILMTGQGDRATDEAAMHRGAADYLQKNGLTGEVLERSVRHAIERTRTLNTSQTRHQNAEMSLQRSEGRFRLAFESIPIGMVALNGDQRIWKSNQAFCAMLGYSERQLLQRPLSDLVHPEDREILQKRIPTVGQSVRLIGSGGAVCWVQYTSVQVQGADHSESYELGMVENKTQDLQRDEQIQQLQKMEEVARLAGGVAHDFNNILTAIQGYADLILRELHVEDPLRRDVEEITKASLRATALTRQLLAFSRKQILQPRTLNVNRIIEDMLRMLGRLIGEDVTINTDLAGDLWWVRLDQGQFEQVIMNLVVNARDAMPQGGTVRLHSSNLEVDTAAALERVEITPGPYVLVRVEDTGQGMSPEVRRHIFDPFYTTRTHGTGLGLATVHGIMKQSGGTVWVDSQVGHGSSFHLLFPAVLTPPEVPQPVSDSKPSHGGLRTILVVEDDDMVRGLTCRVLRRAGYQVMEARGGEEALQMCAAQALVSTGETISLVVTDVVMPGLSGAQFTNQLSVVYPSARVLYTSGYNDEAVLIRGIEAQKVAFLPKPFTPDSLLRSVQAALEGRIL